MPKIEAAIREAIARGARRQVRQVTTPLRREVRRLRGLVAQLRGEVATLRNVAAQWQRTAGAQAWRPQVSEAEAKAARLTPRLIRKLRERLGLTKAALARLAGVSAASVALWERGRATPTGENRRALVALRRLGRREVRRALASLGSEAPAGRRRRRPARRGARRPGRRAPARRPTRG